jgi:1,4-dihydroxy-2-naphthoyl-CoA hydrolase
MTPEELELFKKFKVPFADLIGLQYVEVTRERVRARLVVRPDMCNGKNVIHGGALMAFADTLGAAGTVINLPEGHATATIESKTNFIAGAQVGATLIGEATPVHRGRRTQVWQTRITLEADGGLVAQVTQTQIVLEPRAAPTPAKA